MRRSIHLLLVFALAACGGEAPESEPAPWLAHLKQLSATPGCFATPPPAPIPSDTTDHAIMERARRIETFDKSAFCIDRYRELLDSMLQMPTAESWQIEGNLSFTVPAIQVEASGQSGRFLLDVARSPEVEFDPCMKEQTEISGSGAYTPEYSTIEQGYFILAWTDSAVVYTTPVPPFGDFVRLFRGCDAETGISYGYLPNYEFTQDLVCWTATEFVSCDLATLWPPDVRDSN